MEVSHDPPDVLPRVAERFAVNASWLITLRWVAVIGQLITIAVVVYGLGIRIPLVPLSSLLALTALTNVVLMVWYRLWSPRWSSPDDGAAVRRVLGLVMLVDLLLLTALLYFTGGPANPFSVFYFVNLSLSAVLLPAVWAWFLAGIAIVCFAMLLYDNVPLAGLEIAGRAVSIRETGRITIAHQGILVAFSTCALVVVYFMTRLTQELQLRELMLRRAEAQRARGEKLEALGTLAAGAAHELATPLSTIAVVAKEVERDIRERNINGSLTEDIALIRSELKRCREILDQMSFDAGQATGERVALITVEDLVDEVLSGLPGAECVQAQIAPLARQEKVRVPFVALTRAIRGLVKNALDAAEAPRCAELAVDVDGEWLLIQIRDYGSGMAPEILARVGEPFFTTKQPGQGMGLGIFLAETIVRRLKGRLSIDSAPGTGTLVCVRLPLAGLKANEASSK